MKISNRISKLQKIDEKIIAMQKEREKIIDDAHKKIGEKITEQWDSYDVEEILKVINELAPKAIELLNGPIESNDGVAAESTTISDSDSNAGTV